eukprot:s944_g4.t1
MWCPEFSSNHCNRPSRGTIAVLPRQRHVTDTPWHPVEPGSCQPKIEMQNARLLGAWINFLMIGDFQ